MHLAHSRMVFIPFGWLVCMRRRTSQRKNRKIMNKPSNYTSKPWDSVIGKWEAERIAQNIMVILARTGNEWRQLSWQEYQEERQKDGGFTQMEQSYFEQVVSYCTSAEDANRFCSSWCKK